MGRMEKTVLERAGNGTDRGISWDDRSGSPHDILGVTATASPDTVRRAYLKAMRMCHPDVFPNDPILRKEAEDAAKRINAAYEALCPQRPSVGPPPRRHRPAGSAARDHTSAPYRSPSWDESGNTLATEQRVLISILLVGWLTVVALIFYFLDMWL
jgi:hypothetical protein